GGGVLASDVGSWLVSSLRPSGPSRDGRGTARAPGRPAATRLREADHFAAVDRAEGLEHREGHRVRQEVNGTVAEDEIGPVGVPAAEAPGVLQHLNPRVTAGAQRRPAGGVVDVPPVIADVAVDGGVHAAAPARAEVAGTLLLPGFADGDGVAR